MLNSNIVQETKEITRIRLCSGDVRTCVFLVKNGGNDEFTLIDGGFDEHKIARTSSLVTRSFGTESNAIVPRERRISCHILLRGESFLHEQ